MGVFMNVASVFGLAASFSSDSPQQSLVLNMTYAVVAFSILVQGLTVGRLFSPQTMHRLLKP
jgi:NhaP-type Na+/H+ or K+/H+ antiporter